MTEPKASVAGTTSPSGSYRDWKSWGETTFGDCSPTESRYYDAEFARAGIRADKTTTVLEIGFGNGSFAAWANQRHCSYGGTELDPELVKRAIDRGWRAFPATLDLHELVMHEPPHCIVAWDVLEHLTTAQIVALLKSVASALTDGGTFLARLPSGDSPFARHIQYGDITHRSVIGSSAMHQLAALAGLEVVFIGAPTLPLRGVGIRRFLRRAPIVLLRAVTRRFIRTVFHDNRSTVISPNMIVVLRRKAAQTFGPTTNAGGAQTDEAS